MLKVSTFFLKVLDIHLQQYQYQRTDSRTLLQTGWHTALYMAMHLWKVLYHQLESQMQLYRNGIEN